MHPFSTSGGPVLKPTQSTTTKSSLFGKKTSNRFTKSTKSPKTIALSDFSLEALPLTSLDYPVTALLADDDSLYVGCANGRLIKYPLFFKDTPRTHHIHHHRHFAPLDQPIVTSSDDDYDENYDNVDHFDHLREQTHQINENHDNSNENGDNLHYYPKSLNQKHPQYCSTNHTQANPPPFSPDSTHTTGYMATHHPNILQNDDNTTHLTNQNAFYNLQANQITQQSKAHNFAPATIPLPAVWRLSTHHKIMKNVAPYHRCIPASDDEIMKARGTIPPPSPLNYEQLTSPLHKLPSAIYSMQKCPQNNWLLVLCNHILCLYDCTTLEYIDCLRAFPPTTVLSNSTLPQHYQSSPYFSQTADVSQALLFERFSNGSWSPVDHKVHRQHMKKCRKRQQAHENQMRKEERRQEKIALKTAKNAEKLSKIGNSDDITGPDTEDDSYYTENVSNNPQNTKKSLKKGTIVLFDSSRSSPPSSPRVRVNTPTRALSTTKSTTTSGKSLASSRFSIAKYNVLSLAVHKHTTTLRDARNHAYNAYITSRRAQNKPTSLSLVTAQTSQKTKKDSKNSKNIESSRENHNKPLKKRLYDRIIAHLARSNTFATSTNLAKQFIPPHIYSLLRAARNILDPTTYLDYAGGMTAPSFRAQPYPSHTQLQQMHQKQRAALEQYECELSSTGENILNLFSSASAQQLEVNQFAFYYSNGVLHLAVVSPGAKRLFVYEAHRGATNNVAEQQRKMDILIEQNGNTIKDLLVKEDGEKCEINHLLIATVPPQLPFKYNEPATTTENKEELSKHVDQLYKPTAEQRYLRDLLTDQTNYESAQSKASVSRVIWRLRSVYHLGDHNLKNIQFLSVFFLCFITDDNAYILNINDHVVRSILDLCLESVISSKVGMISPTLHQHILEIQGRETTVTTNESSDNDSNDSDNGEKRDSTTLNDKNAKADDFDHNPLPMTSQPMKLRNNDCVSPIVLNDEKPDKNDKLRIELNPTLTITSQSSTVGAFSTQPLSEHTLQQHRLPSSHHIPITPTLEPILSQGLATSPNVIFAPKSPIHPNFSLSNQFLSQNAPAFTNSSFSLTNHHVSPMPSTPGLILGSVNSSISHYGHMAQSFINGSGFDPRALFSMPNQTATNYLSTPLISGVSAVNALNQYNENIPPNTHPIDHSQNSQTPENHAVSQQSYDVSYVPIFTLRYTATNTKSNTMRYINMSRTPTSTNMDPATQLTSPPHSPCPIAGIPDPQTISTPQSKKTQTLTTFVFSPRESSFLEHCPSSSPSKYSSFSPSIAHIPAKSVSLQSPIMLQQQSTTNPNQLHTLIVSPSPSSHIPNPQSPPDRPTSPSESSISLSPSLTFLDTTNITSATFLPLLPPFITPPSVSPAVNTPSDLLLAKLFGSDEVDAYIPRLGAAKGSLCLEPLCGSSLSPQSSHVFGSPAQLGSGSVLGSDSSAELNSAWLNNAILRPPQQEQSLGAILAQSFAHNTPVALKSLLFSLQTTNQYKVLTMSPLVVQTLSNESGGTLQHDLKSKNQQTAVQQLKSFLSTLPDVCKGGIHPPTVQFIRPGELSVCIGRYMFFLNDLTMDKFNSTSISHSANYTGVADINIDCEVTDITSILQPSSKTNDNLDKSAQVTENGVDLCDTHNLSPSHTSDTREAHSHASTNSVMFPNSHIPSYTSSSPRQNNQFAGSLSSAASAEPQPPVLPSLPTSPCVHSTSPQSLLCDSCAHQFELQKQQYDIDYARYKHDYALHIQSLSEPTPFLRKQLTSNSTVSSHPSHPQVSYPETVLPTSLSVHKHIVPIPPSIQHTGQSFDNLFCSQPQPLPVNPLRVSVMTELQYYALSNWNELNSAVHHSLNEVDFDLNCSEQHQRHYNALRGEPACNHVPTAPSDTKADVYPQNNARYNSINNNNSLLHLPPSLAHELCSNSPCPLLTSNTGVYFLLTSIQESHLMRVDCTRSMLPLPVYVPRKIYMNRTNHSVTSSPIPYTHSKYQLPSHIMTLPIYATMLLHPSDRPKKAKSEASARCSSLDPDENEETEYSDSDDEWSALYSQRHGLNPNGTNNFFHRPNSVLPLTSSNTDAGPVSPPPPTPTATGKFRNIFGRSKILDFKEKESRNEKIHHTDSFPVLALPSHPSNQELYDTSTTDFDIPMDNTSYLLQQQRDQSYVLVDSSSTIDGLYDQQARESVAQQVYQQQLAKYRKRYKKVQQINFMVTGQAQTIDMEVEVFDDYTFSISDQLFENNQLSENSVQNVQITQNNPKTMINNSQIGQGVNFNFNISPSCGNSAQYSSNCSETSSQHEHIVTHAQCTGITTPGTTSIAGNIVLDLNSLLQRRLFKRLKRNQVLTTFLLHAPFTYTYSLQYLQSVNFSFSPPFQATQTLNFHSSIVADSQSSDSTPIKSSDTPLGTRTAQLQLVQNIAASHFGISPHFPIFSYRNHVWIFQPTPSTAENPMHFFASLSKLTSMTLVTKKLTAWLRVMLSNGSTLFGRPLSLFADYICAKYGMHISSYTFSITQDHEEYLKSLDSELDNEIMNKFVDTYMQLNPKSSRDELIERYRGKRRKTKDFSKSGDPPPVPLAVAKDETATLHKELYLVDGEMIFPSRLGTQTALSYTYETLYQSFCNEVDGFVNSLKDNICIKYGFLNQNNDYSELADVSTIVIREVLYTLIQHCVDPIVSLRLSHQEALLQRLCDLYHNAQPTNFGMELLSISPDHDDSYYDDMINDAIKYQQRQASIGEKNQSSSLSRCAQTAVMDTNAVISSMQANVGKYEEQHASLLDSQGSQSSLQLINSKSELSTHIPTNVHAFTIIPHLSLLPIRIHQTRLSIPETLFFQPAIDALRQIGLTRGVGPILQRISTLFGNLGTINTMADDVWKYRARKVAAWRDFKEKIGQIIEWKSVGDKLKMVMIQAKKRFGFLHPYANAHPLTQSQMMALKYEDFDQLRFVGGVAHDEQTFEGLRRPRSSVMIEVIATSPLGDTIATVAQNLSDNLVDNFDNPCQLVNNATSQHDGEDDENQTEMNEFEEKCGHKTHKQCPNCQVLTPMNLQLAPSDSSSQENNPSRLFLELQSQTSTAPSPKGNGISMQIQRSPHFSTVRPTQGTRSHWQLSTTHQNTANSQFISQIKLQQQHSNPTQAVFRNGPHGDGLDYGALSCEGTENHSKLNSPHLPKLPANTTFSTSSPSSSTQQTPNLTPCPSSTQLRQQSSALRQHAIAHDLSAPPPPGYCTCFNLAQLPRQIYQLLASTGTTFDSFILSVIYSEEEFTIPPCSCPHPSVLVLIPPDIPDTELDQYDHTTTWYRGALHLKADNSAVNLFTETHYIPASNYKPLAQWVSLPADDLLPLISWCVLKANSRTQWDVSRRAFEKYRLTLCQQYVSMYEAGEFGEEHEKADPFTMDDALVNPSHADGMLLPYQCRQRSGGITTAPSTTLNPPNTLGNATQNVSKFHSNIHINESLSSVITVPIGSSCSKTSPKSKFPLHPSDLESLLNFEPIFNPIRIAKIEYMRATYNTSEQDSGQHQLTSLHMYAAMESMVQDVPIPDQLHRVAQRNQKLAQISDAHRRALSPPESIVPRLNAPRTFGADGINSPIFASSPVDDDDDDGCNGLEPSSSSYQDRVKNLTKKYRRPMLGASLFVSPTVVDDYF